MILLNPIGWTEDGCISAAHRYSSPERIADYIERRPDNEQFPGLLFWDPLNRWPSDQAYVVMDSLLWLLRITPTSLVQIGYVDIEDPTSSLPLPAVTDCDEAGLCRCGCGLRAGTVSP